MTSRCVATAYIRLWIAHELATVCPFSAPANVALGSLVDIHIVRGDAELCPKQNLDFALEDADMVELGPLLC